MKSDPYFDTDICVNRLINVYEKHGDIIIAVDFDETIYPFHNSNDRFEKIITLLQKCSELKLSIIVFTSGLNERHDFMRNYCEENGITISTINQNCNDRIKYGRDGAKIYYNILLDDKAGLGQAYNILTQTIEYINK